MFKLESGNSRCSWGNDETRNLLAIMKELKVMELLDGKTRRNKNVYILISNELAKKGFNKTSDQIKLKFRTLKQEFYKTKRGNSKSGAGRKTMAHMQDLEELLGDRLVAAAAGLDTTVVEEIDICIGNEEEYLDETDDTDVNPTEECGPQQPVDKVPKKKRSAIQNTLLEIAADFKESHQSTLQMVKEENEMFIAEQRRLHDEYLKDTRDIMAEDRKETRQMLLDILHKEK